MWGHERANRILVWWRNIGLRLIRCCGFLPQAGKKKKHTEQVKLDVFDQSFKAFNFTFTAMIHRHIKTNVRTLTGISETQIKKKPQSETKI